MDLPLLAKTLAEKDSSLLQLYSNNERTVVLVRKNANQELVFWYWSDDAKFHTGFYGPEAAAVFDTIVTCLKKGPR